MVKEFVQFYYQAFDTDRNKLASIYRDESILTFEGARFIGINQIGEKFRSLTFNRSQHTIHTLDYQPSPQGGVFVLISGQILPEGETHPLRFSQTFHLAPTESSCWLTNDVFRLTMN
eukprot:g6423.t1